MVNRVKLRKFLRLRCQGPDKGDKLLAQEFDIAGESGADIIVGLVLDNERRGLQAILEVGRLRQLLGYRLLNVFAACAVRFVVVTKEGSGAPESQLLESCRQCCRLDAVQHALSILSSGLGQHHDAVADGADGLFVLRRAERQREVDCHELVDTLRVNDLSDSLFVATGKEYKVVSGKVKGGVRPRYGVCPFCTSDHSVVLGNDGLGGSKEQLGDAL